MGDWLSVLSRHEEQDRIAIRDGTSDLTYAACCEMLKELALSLPLHVDRIGLMMDQSAQAILILMTLMDDGIAVLPVDDKQTRADLMRIERTCPVDLWIIPDEKWSSLYHDTDDHLHMYSEYLPSPTSPETRREWLKREKPRFGELYLLTSGSTGQSKAVCHSSLTLQREGNQYRRWFGYHAGDRVLVTVPLNHLYGLSGGLAAAMLAGATLIICRHPAPRKVYQMVETERATLLLAVPVMIQLMNDLRLKECGGLYSLRAAICAGGRLEPETAARFQERFQVRLLQLYGSTETGAIAAESCHHYHRHPSRYVGALLPQIEARLAASGRLSIRSPSLCLGYTEGNQMIPCTEDGWYETDDLAEIRDGQLVLLGRVPNFINVAGRKVYPLEIEEVCRSLPSIQDARVWGTADSLHGERIVVEFVATESMSVPALKQALRAQLASYKIPHEWIQVEKIHRGWKHAPAGETDGE
ncbi:class I adenylate-forming enzyme family protein [Marinicrinis sediminis]|uniref:Class I adenylate-forming enzyme family protein n=1 Tax=Marinicrinis sediminis TaxID=1652465 RepID=A0ABW5REC8_9BACL